MKLECLTKNPTQTKKLGKFLAKEILRTPSQKKALILGLKGDLGGGKTTFLQGFAKGLGIKNKILSPTFVIMKKFIIPKKNIGDTYVNFYHIDCYRIEKTKEILDLGFKEIISNPENIVAAEWAERIKGILPKGSLFISFEFADKTKRKIMIKY